MSPEIYSATKPAVAWRGPVVTLLLLLAVTVLAGLLVRQRSGVRLAPVEMEQGWHSTYELPVGSVPAGHASYERWQMAQFAVRVDPEARILLWERPIEPGVSGETLADAVLAMTSLLSGRILMQSLPASDGIEYQIGSIAGPEVRSEDRTLLARAAVYGNQAFAVSMVSADPADPGTAAYDRFDRTCRSMRLRGVNDAN